MDPDKHLLEKEEISAKEIHVDKVFKKIWLSIISFFKLIKRSFKPLFLLTIVVLLMWAGYSLKNCPVCEECKICEVCVACPDLDCTQCPKETERVTEIRYACSNGLIVDDIDKCNPLNHIKIESIYKETDNGVTLSIDKVKTEDVGSYSKIIEIDYTIVNLREHDIKPIVLVNIYSNSDERSEQGYVHEIFEDEEYIASNAWVIKKQKTNIGFKDENVIRLVLKDTLPDPDVELVRVSKDLII